MEIVKVFLVATFLTMDELVHPMVACSPLASVFLQGGDLFDALVSVRHLPEREVSARERRSSKRECHRFSVLLGR